MRRQTLGWVVVLVVGSALGWETRALGQNQVKVQVTVPAVPNIGVVAPSQTPSDLAVAPRGVVYIGSRSVSDRRHGHEGHAMFRDANNQFWDNSLTYYGMSNGYWIASVNGIPTHSWPSRPRHRVRGTLFQGVDPHAFDNRICGVG